MKECVVASKYGEECVVALEDGVVACERGGCITSIHMKKCVVASRYDVIVCERGVCMTSIYMKERAVVSEKGEGAWETRALCGGPSPVLVFPDEVVDVLACRVRVALQAERRPVHGGAAKRRREVAR